MPHGKTVKFKLIGLRNERCLNQAGPFMKYSLRWCGIDISVVSAGLSAHCGRGSVAGRMGHLGAIAGTRTLR